MAKWDITPTALRLNPHVFDVAEFKKMAVQEIFNTQKRLRTSIAGGSNADGEPIKPGGYSEGYKEMIEKAKNAFAAREALSDYNLYSYDENGKQHRESKTKKGRSRKHTSIQNKLAQKDPNVVDLFVTGQMLNSWNISELPAGAQLSFPNHQLGKVSGLLTRGFQGWVEFGKVDLDRITKAANELVGRLLTKAVEKK